MYDVNARMPRHVTAQDSEVRLLGSLEAGRTSGLMMAALQHTVTRRMSLTMMLIKGLLDNHGDGHEMSI